MGAAWIWLELPERTERRQTSPCPSHPETGAASMSLRTTARAAEQCTRRPRDEQEEYRCVTVCPSR
jgi:hypothetical protein